MPYMNKAADTSKKSTKASEKAKLEQFNTEMGAKISALQFTKPIKVDTNSIDVDFVALANHKEDPDYQQPSATLRSRDGIGGVRSATHAKRGILSPSRYRRLNRYWN